MSAKGTNVNAAWTSRSSGRALIAACGALLTACTVLDSKPIVKAHVEAVRKGPEAVPTRTITNFSPALRCMDGLLITWGIRDLPVVVEDLIDQTKKVNAGTKDMLISAMSEMTRRSKAIKLITYGKDTGNLIGLIESAKGRNAFQNVPPYGIRGSVSQLDDNILRRNVDIGIAFDPYLSIGASGSAGASVLGIDLTVVSSRDLAVVPGVTSRNSVVLYREGSGFDGDAAIRKFGVNFSMTLSRSEGQAQALRTLVELAVIELVGKLGTLPYWRCLGTSADDPEVAAEREDWYYGLASRPAELIGFFQFQLRNRGYYRGPSNGQRSAEFDRSVEAYRKALDLPPSRELDLPFFNAYLAADHAAVLARFPAPALLGDAPPEPVAKGPETPASVAVASAASRSDPDSASTAKAASPAPIAPAPAIPALAVPEGTAPPSRTVAGAMHAEPLRLAIQSRENPHTLRRNQPFRLAITTTRDAHVYCYLRDEHKKVQRIFPNRFDEHSIVKKTHPLDLPGNGRFQLLTSPRGVTEAIVCYATDRDVLALLPKSVAGRDFEDLPVASIEEVKQAFRSIVSDNFSEGVFHVRVN